MSFIINQNFDLKSPQFNFARDYFENIDALKAYCGGDWSTADYSSFPDHFITNVGGTLYILDKSATDNATSGKWDSLQVSVDDWFALFAGVTTNATFSGNSLIFKDRDNNALPIDFPIANKDTTGLLKKEFYNTIQTAISKGDTTADELESLGNAYQTTKGQVETNKNDIATIKDQIGTVSGNLSNYLTTERFDTVIDSIEAGMGTDKTKTSLWFKHSADTKNNVDIASKEVVLPEVSDIHNGLMTPDMLTKLKGLNNYSLPTAADGTLGGIEIGYKTNGKNYPVQLDGNKAFVYVPWTDTDTKYTLPEATSSAMGGAKLASDDPQSVAANAITNTASRTYGVQKNKDGQLVVNVPWENTVTVVESIPDDTIKNAFK